MNQLRVNMAPIRVAEIGRYQCFSALTATWISLSKRPREDEIGLHGPELLEDPPHGQTA
jgi:hypothetical protein